MNLLLLISSALLWATALFMGFLLLGTFRALALLRWRLDQLEATTPRRGGLRHGARAPDFSLPHAEGGQLALHDLAGRPVLLVFAQPGCGPCRALVPELNRLHSGGDLHVLVVNNSEPEASRQWAGEVGARFPVLAQEGLSLSRRYQVFATPFAFLIDASGVIRSKGLVSNKQHIDFVLSGASEAEKGGQAATAPAEVESAPA
jgi:methylamine dehydrogenase accessory protein MauD